MDRECASGVPEFPGSLEQDCEVVVVGGGAVGASVAYHVAREGRAVALIDRGEWCSGTSGATFSWVGAHGQTPVSYHRFRRESIGRYSSLGGELGIDVEYRPMGSLELLETPEELRRASDTVRRMQEEGYALRLIGAEELYHLEPHISRGFAGATLCPVGGVVNPFRVTLGFLRAASRVGATLYPRTELHSIAIRDGRVSGLTTSRGEVRPKYVVLAAGVGAARIASGIGVSLPMRPVRGQVLVTEPLPPLFFHIISDARQTCHGNILIGRTDEEGVTSTRTSAEGMATLARRFVRLAPSLRGVKVIRAYAGLRPLPADGLPILGRIPGVEGLVVAVVHSGITLAPLVGELIAQIISSGEPRISLQPYALERFGQHVPAAPGYCRLDSYGPLGYSAG